MKTASPYDAAIKAIADVAARQVDVDADGTIIVGLGSGRAATAVVKALIKLAECGRRRIVGVPTSLQIKLVVEEADRTGSLHLIEADQTDTIDIAFDGADQIDSHGYLVKGGGGALLRENILFNMATKIVVMADRTKFVKNISRPIPVEVHHLARRLVQKKILDLGGDTSLRMQNSGYPVFTENGNVILDCNFGIVSDPKRLTNSIKRIPGVVESGIFIRRPDLIYKAGVAGKFKVISKISSRSTDLYTEDDPDLVS